MSKKKRNQLNPDELLAYYIQLGKGKRSYQKVADHFNCSKQRVDEIGKENKWVEEAEKYDNEVHLETIEKIKDIEVTTRVLLNTANNESILTYIRMISGKDSISVEQAKVLDLLGRLWKELETPIAESVNTQVETVNGGINAPVFNLNFNKNSKPEDYDDGSYEVEDGDDFEEETAEEFE